MPAVTEKQLLDQARALFPSVQSRWQLDADAAALYAIADAAFLLYLGRRAPEIISGFRTPEHQRRLRDQGRPAARQSWHLAGRAIDVDSSNPDVPLFAQVWEYLGGRSGHTFGDPNHFDVPGPQLPPPAW